MGTKQAPPSLWSKAFKRDAVWTKSELEEVVHWARQIFAVLCGIVWGVVPLKGAVGLLGFLGLNYVLIFLYYSKYLGIEDEEDVGSSRSELAQEGFVTSIGMFFLSWIIVYNLIYFN